MMMFPSAIIAFALLDSLHDAAAAVPPPSEVTNVSGTGDLDVTATPLDGGSIQRGAARVAMAKLNLAASCDADVAVSSVRVTHRGLGSVRDLRSVWLSDGVRRLGRSARFDVASGQAVARLSSFVVPRCEVRVMTVMVDIAPDAATSGEHRLEIDGANAIDASAHTVSLQHEDATEKVIVTPYDASRVTVNFLPVRSRLQYGTRMTVARLQITGDPSRAMYLRRIVLTNMEDARDMDLRNLALQTRSGETLTGPALRLYGREARLDFTPMFRVERGAILVIDLVADVRASGYRKASFQLLESSDIDVLPASPRS